MRFDIALERTYPHPRETVWRALTDRDALGYWLMETDFAPEEGRAFHMLCENPRGGTDRYLCRVLALEPPARMLWSWRLEVDRSDADMQVEFLLEKVADGTRLTIRHRGDRDPTVVDAFESGWPEKIERLAELLGEARPSGDRRPPRSAT